MAISTEQWKLFGTELRLHGNFEEARKIADIDFDDYYEAHSSKDPQLKEEMMKFRLQESEKAIEALHANGIGKGRSQSAIKILESYMPEIFRQKMAHKVQIEAKHAVAHAFANPNLMLPTTNQDSLPPAEPGAVSEHEGSRLRLQGATSITEAVKRRALELEVKGSSADKEQSGWEKVHAPVEEEEDVVDAEYVSA